MASLLRRFICQRGLNLTLPQPATFASPVPSMTTTISGSNFSTSSRMLDDDDDEEEAAPRGPRVDMRFHNHVTLMGRVARGPRTVGEGPQAVTYLDLVTKRYYENNDGEVVEDPHFHNVIVTNKTKGIHNYVRDQVRKGDRLYVEGSLQYNVKETADGRSKKEPTIRVDDLIAVASAY